MGPMGLPGLPGATGPAGPTGPQGPPGVAGPYWAGWIRPNSNGTITIRHGNGFTVTRVGLTGSYRITIQPTTSANFLVTTVSAALPTAHAVVTAYTKSGTGVHTVDIEISTIATGAFVDSDFNFIIVERS